MAPILTSTLVLSFLAGCGGPTTSDRSDTDDPEIVVSDEVRVARLSHTQWENAVRDLLGLERPLGLSAAFVQDAVMSEFDNDDASLGVDQVLFQQYQDAAYQIAQVVLSDPEVYRHVVGDRLGEEAPEDFIRRFGRKVHREPLTDEQVEQYVGAWEVGVEKGSAPDPATDGLRQLVASFFQSPYFLYRVEEAGEVQEGELVVGYGDDAERFPIVHVNPHDLAARLSFALWNTIPDAELDALADDGSLREEVVLRAQVDRMLLDPRAAVMLEDLHDQLLLVDLYVNIAPDTVLYPDFDPATVPAMQAEVRAFVDEIVRTGGGVRDLLLSRRTFVDPLLAKVYGIEGVPDSGRLEPVDLPAEERAGLLTLSGFLASNSDPNVSNPIRRGFFVNTSIICQLLPPPPAGAGAIPPAGEDQTTRERIASATAECGLSCHNDFINPAGFAFEHYGPTGEYRTEERGMPIDASEEYPFAEGLTPYDDAVEFSGLLAESPQVHACYSRHLFQYLYGRYPDYRLGDETLVTTLGTASLDDDLSTRTLVKELVVSQAFRSIPPDLPPIAPPEVSDTSESEGTTVTTP